MSLQTRESSTLVIVTFLASVSLLLLTVPIANKGDNSDDELKLSEVAPIGFFFSLIGLLYRQATAWTIDRIAYNRNVDFRWNDASFWRNHKYAYYVYGPIRGFLVLWFLSLPVVLWALIWNPALEAFSVWHVIIFLSAMVALALTGIDVGLRCRDWDRHH